MNMKMKRLLWLTLIITLIQEEKVCGRSILFLTESCNSTYILSIGMCMLWFRGIPSHTRANETMSSQPVIPNHRMISSVGCHVTSLSHVVEQSKLIFEHAMSWRQRFYSISRMKLLWYHRYSFARNCATWLTEKGMRNDSEISWLPVILGLDGQDPS
jgi:hypothetical protein